MELFCCTDWLRLTPGASRRTFGATWEHVDLFLEHFCLLAHAFACYKWFLEDWPVFDRGVAMGHHLLVGRVNDEE